MKKAIWLFSLYVSFLCAVFFFIYGFTGLTIGWMSFVMLAVYFGMGSKVKDFPSVFCSTIAGLIWGQLNYAFLALMNLTGLPAATVMFIGITVVTTITMGLHIAVLGNTVLGKLPFVFACVALTFSQGGKNETGLAFTLIAGIILALLCSLGENYIFSHFAQQTEKEVQM